MDVAQNPDAVEREIERSRAQLAETIDAIADRVSPRRVAERGTGKLRTALESARGRVSARSALPAGGSNPRQSSPGGAGDRLGALAARGRSLLATGSNPGGGTGGDRLGALTARSRSLVAAGRSSASRLPLGTNRAALAGAAAAVLLLLAVMLRRRHR